MAESDFLQLFPNCFPGIEEIDMEKK